MTNLKYRGRILDTGSEVLLECVDALGKLQRQHMGSETSGWCIASEYVYRMFDWLTFTEPKTTGTEVSVEFYTES